MESQSESYERVGFDPAQEPIRKDAKPGIISEPGSQARRLLDEPDNTASHLVPDEPDEDEVKAGAHETIAYYEHTTRQKFATEGVDEATAKILHRLCQERERWSDAMVDDAECTLQFLHPDNGGNRQHGPI